MERMKAVQKYGFDKETPTALPQIEEPVDNTDEDGVYVWFPVSFMRFYGTNQFIEEVLPVALAGFVDNLKNANERWVAERLLFAYMKNKYQNLYGQIFQAMHDYDVPNNAPTYWDDDALEAMYDLFADNPKLYAEAEEIAKCIFAAEKLSFSKFYPDGHSPLEVLEDGRLVLRQHHKEPMVSVNVDILGRAIIAGDDTAFVYALFMAIKSIVPRPKPNKPTFLKTNWDHVLSRAFGYRSIKEVPDDVKSSQLWKENCTHWRRRALLKRLQKFKVHSYSTNGMRGFLIGIGGPELYDHFKNYLVKSKYQTTEIDRKKRAISDALKAIK